MMQNRSTSGEKSLRDKQTVHSLESESAMYQFAGYCISFLMFALKKDYVLSKNNKKKKNKHIYNFSSENWQFYSRISLHVYVYFFSVSDDEITFRIHRYARAKIMCLVIKIFLSR